MKIKKKNPEKKKDAATGKEQNMQRLLHTVPMPLIRQDQGDKQEKKTYDWTLDCSKNYFLQPT
jgi:hypothetical protein